MAANTWPAARSVGGDAAVWVASTLLFLALASVVLGVSREPGASMLLWYGGAVLLAAAGGVLLVLALAYRRLAYSLTDTALHIAWLGRMEVVPYHAILGIYTGQRLSRRARPHVLNWPGIRVGPARVRGLGRICFFATSTQPSMLTLITFEQGGVVLSARDPAGFRAALIERVQACQEDAADPRPRQRIPPATAPWSALGDLWLPGSAALGVLVLLLVLAAIVFRFDALSDQIALHFDAGGRPNDMAPKSDLLRLPLFGLGCLLANWMLGAWLHPRERVLARLLWIGGVVVQLVLLLAMLRLVA